MDSAQRALKEPSKTIDGICICDFQDCGGHKVGSEGTKQNKTIDGRTVTVKVAADGQKEKLSSQPAVSPQMQTAYGKDYPSLNSYHRPGPQAFEQYGEIEEGVLIMDKTSGKSRGFVFVTFKHMDSAQRALKEPSKTIAGRTTVTNLAVASTGPGQSADQAQRKLYIGGLSYDMAKDKLLKVSSKYGEIEECSVAYDKNTNKSRGFAFVTFKTLEATKQALKESNKTIDGRTVTMKLAADGQKEKLSSQPAISPQMHTAYGTDYSSLNSYHRPGPQVSTSAPPPIGFSAYASQPPYATQPTYGGISSASQYGVLSSTTPYSSNQYAKYATSLQDPRLVPSGLHTTGGGAGPGPGYPYYGSTGTGF